MDQIIKLSDSAATRIKEIMSNAEKNAIGVRVSVKSGASPDVAKHFLIFE